MTAFDVHNIAYILRSIKFAVSSVKMTNFFYSGCRSGAIYHHDVRVADHHVATLSTHSQEVCGLKWSRDGKYLASGGNDNLLLIWDANISSSGDVTSPLFTLTDHQAAVKVLLTVYTIINQISP